MQRADVFVFQGVAPQEVVEPGSKFCGYGVGSYRTGRYIRSGMMDQFGNNPYNTGNPVGQGVSNEYGNPTGQGNTNGYGNPAGQGVPSGYDNTAGQGVSNGYGNPTGYGNPAGYGDPYNQGNRPYMNADLNRAPRLPLFNEPMQRQGQDALLECRNLVKKYTNNRPPALEDINLYIEPGHIVGLLGPNGSGKTTLIKLANGLLQPTSGEILIYGQKPGAASKSIISYLPERTYVDAQKTVSKLLDFFADMYQDFDENRALQMLAALGINPDDRLKTMSKGTREKVQLILVMSRDAGLYILDEPIAGVDPAARDYIIRTMLNNYNPHASILISTHLISDIENILDDAIFIRYGHIFAQCPASRIHDDLNMSIDAYFREVFAC